MAVTQETLFRVVQIYKGNIVQDLVLRDPEPITIGIHKNSHRHPLRRLMMWLWPWMRMIGRITSGIYKDYHMVAPIPGRDPGYVIFSPLSGGFYELNLPLSDGQAVLEGKLTRADGSTASAEELLHQGGKVPLAPGDWGRFHVAGSDGVEVFCQYVRIPIKHKANPVLRPFVALSEAVAGTLGAAVDQYVVLAGVVLVTFLMFCFMHKPHGTSFESEKVSRRFSTMFRSAPKKAAKDKKDEKDKKRKAVVIKEARDLVRRPQRSAARSDRVLLSRRDVRNRRINKGSLLALNRAIRSSSAVNRLFRQQDSLFSDVEKGLSGLTGPGGSGGGGSGDGIEDPYATRGGGGGGAVGRTDSGKGPRLGMRIGNRGMLSGRGFRKVRVARVGLGGGSVSGTGLTRAQIFRVVRARRGFIKWCYENALKRNPTMGGGKITVQFKIAPTGRVVQARVASNSLKGGGGVGSCITRAIRRWRFSQSQGYSVVRFPFLFSSGLK